MFDWTGVGLPFRENQKRRPLSCFRVGNSPAKWHFWFERRFLRSLSSRRKANRQTVYNDKSGSPFQHSPCRGVSFAETGCRTSHFQSLKMSSKALSNAAFILFSIMLITSASRMDFFFFLSFSRSFVDFTFTWSAPHLWFLHSSLRSALPLPIVQNERLPSSGEVRIKSTMGYSRPCASRHSSQVFVYRNVPVVS